MKIQFAVFDKVEELDLVGSWELVGLLSEKGHCEKPKLISLNAMNPVGEHGMRFSADYHFSSCPLPDVLIVPGGIGARQAMEDPAVISFLQNCNKSCQSILSICTGMYLLQKASLLVGKKATTHWAFLDHLKNDPTVTVVEERFVKDQNIWSSAGVSAGMDMMLAYIAETFGEDVASTLQLDAEYYPSPKIYGSPQANPKASAYIRALKTH